MQRLEVSGAVRPLYGSLGVKGLKLVSLRPPQWMCRTNKTKGGNEPCASILDGSQTRAPEVLFLFYLASEICD